MTPVCNGFKDLANVVWAVLPRSYEFGVRMGEETITDCLLYSLATSCADSVKVYKSKRAEERATGADWEWCIGGRGAWFPMRVQAKKLDPRNGLFPNLMRNKGRQRTRQVNALLRSASASGSYPLYCFYTCEVNGEPASSSCRCDSYVPLMGCVVADAHAVRAMILRKENTLADVVQIAHPWHCLVCCDHGDVRLADRVRASVVQLREELRSTQNGFAVDDWAERQVRRGDTESESPRQRLGFDAVPEPLQVPPAYAQELLEYGGDARDEVLEHRCFEKSVTGFVVVSED